MDYNDIFRGIEARLFDSFDINTDIDDEGIMDRIQVYLPRSILLMLMRE